MGYLIDGHNLIPKLRGFSLNDMDDEQQLIEKLQGFCQARRKPLEVFFDRAAPGQSGKKKFGALTAHFIRPGITADQAIIQRLQKMGKSAASWTVVSSDRRVQIEAHALKAQVMASEQFAAYMDEVVQLHLQTAPAPFDRLSEAEVEDWLRIFQQNRPN